MTWGRPRGGRARAGRCGVAALRRSVQTDEGWLSWDVRPVATRAKGRTRLGFLDGRPISDDELELRLADLERLRRSA